MTVFERFTSVARDIVVKAQEEARELEHCWIGTEHLLLALLRDGSTQAAAVLKEAGVTRDLAQTQLLRLLESGPDELDAEALRSIGIDVDAVRSAVEGRFGPGALDLPPKRRRGLRRWRRHPRSGGHTPWTDKAKKALELSLREAVRLKHDQIAPEHLLLGIIREGSGLALKVLVELEVQPEQVRSDLEARMRLISSSCTTARRPPRRAAGPGGRARRARWR